MMALDAEDHFSDSYDREVDIEDGEADIEPWTSPWPSLGFSIADYDWTTDGSGNITGEPKSA